MDKIGNVTIRKRSNGKYEYRFEVEPVDGKRRWKTKSGFVRKKEAREAGNRARAEYIERDGKPERKQENISVNTLSGIWMEKVAAKREITTYATYESMLRLHILPSIGKKAVRKVDYSDIESMLQEMADNGSSKSTMQVTKAVASKMFGYAVKPMRIIQYNPCKDADIPESRKQKKERTPYTPEQIQQIMEAVPYGNDYRLPLVLGIHCGLRIGEVLGLTWDNVDLQAGTITVEMQLKSAAFKHKVYHVYKKPKNKTSCRIIHIDSFVKQELMEEKKRQAEMSQRYGAYYFHNQVQELDIGQNKTFEYVLSTCTPAPGTRRLNLVCRQENGCHMTSQSFNVRMHHLSQKLGFKVESHTGRHTHATLIVENGGSVSAVSARLGHSSLNTTSIYVHGTDTADIDAMERFENLLSTN